MKKGFTILIADRNRHVREFLKREMMAEGNNILLAKSGQEVLKCIYDHNKPLDLLILELDLPDIGGLSILEKLQDRIPTLPVVVHTYLSEYLYHPDVLCANAVVEKKGTNIDRLKEVVSDVLRKSYGHIKRSPTRPARCETHERPKRDRP